MANVMDRKKEKRHSQNLHLEDTAKTNTKEREQKRDFETKKGSSKDEHHTMVTKVESSEEEGADKDDDSTQRGYVSVTIEQGRQEELISNEGMELVIDASRSMEIDSIFPENLISDIFLSTQPLGFGVRVLPEEGLEVSLQDESLLTFTGPSQIEQDQSNFLTLRIIAIENEEIFLKIKVDSTASPRPASKPTAIIKGYPSMFPDMSATDLQNFIKTPHLNFKLTTAPSSHGSRERRALVISRPSDGKEVVFKVREVQAVTPVLDCTIIIPHQEFYTQEWNIVTDEWLIPSFEIVEEGNIKLRGYTEMGPEHPT